LGAISFVKLDVEKSKVTWSLSTNGAFTRDVKSMLNENLGGILGGALLDRKCKYSLSTVASGILEGTTPV
jgi:hypothetical protein